MTPEPQPDGSRNIRLVLAYDGTPYLGWQVQPQGPTVQSVLEAALERITGVATAVKGSGRTDAGVHALGQVANFHTRARMAPGAFVAALNSVLPPTIAVLGADEVAPCFDAQFSAVGKLYRYRVFNSRTRSPFERARSWQCTGSLSIESMSVAASQIIGCNDFSTFRASGCVATHPVRNLTRCDVYQHGEFVLFDLEADGFLRHMVRNIVGTLIDIGRGRFPQDCITAMLAARDRRQGGITAPPHGLYLVRVSYPGGCSGSAALPAPSLVPVPVAPRWPPIDKCT